MTKLIKITNTKDGGYFQRGYGFGFKKNKAIYQDTTTDKFYVKDAHKANLVFDRTEMTELGYVEVKPLTLGEHTKYHEVG